MISILLSDLIERDVTTVKEISEITERGQSTVYRWVHGETQPDMADVAKLIRKLSRPEARRSLVEIFTVGLPLRIEWLATDQTLVALDQSQPSPDVMDLALLTIECLSKVMHNERDTFQRGEVTEKIKYDLEQLLGTAINYLTLAQQVVEDTPVTRRKAR